MRLVRFVQERPDHAIVRTIRNSDGNSKFRRRHAMMPHDRRLSIRKTPKHLGYLSLPPDNGGFVLDVSVGGLGFQAIAPVKAVGPIRFRFAIDSPERITAVGELAWIDDTGKAGGLRFTELPDGVREQIRIWTGQPKESPNDIPVVEAVADTGGEPSVGSDSAPATVLAADEPAIEAEVTAPIIADPAPAEAASDPLLPNPKPPIFSGPSNTLSMFSLGQNSGLGAPAVAVPQSAVIRHPVAAVGLTIALAFLVSMGICACVFTSRAGDLLFGWGQKMWGGVYSQPIPKYPAPPASPAPDSSNSIQQ